MLTGSLLACISRPVRPAVGDRDNTVAVEELRDEARLLPAGEYEVLPNTAHPVDHALLERLVWPLQQFYSSVDRTADVHTA